MKDKPPSRKPNQTRNENSQATGVPKEVLELATSSGNSFHARVVGAFRENEWHTMVSPYYVDAATNLAREIDLVAEKDWKVPGFWADRQDRHLHIRLLIECKYIAQDTLFWFDAQDSRATGQWLKENTPLPTAEPNTYTTKHHYWPSENLVAKLFSSKASQETDREVMYKAVNQSLHATVYLRARKEIIPRKGRGGSLLTTVVYPVILVNSLEKFYRVEMTAPGSPKPLTENFQLEVNFAYRDSGGINRTEYFLIDVVALDRLSSFLALMDGDAAVMSAFLEPR